MDGINSGITPAVPLQGKPTSSQLSPQDALRLREAAADFESMFVKQMLSSMRKTIPKQDGGLIKESEGEKMFRDMLDGEYAKTTSRSGSRSGHGVGLGASMYRQMVARFGETGPVPTIQEAKQKVDQFNREGKILGGAGRVEQVDK